jgi:hypothetical protein
MSDKRFELLGGPGGRMTCLPIGDARRNDRYRRWTRLLVVNRPLTMARADAAQRWALEVFDVV